MKARYDSFTARKAEIQNIISAHNTAASHCDIRAMKKLGKMLDKALNKINNISFEINENSSDSPPKRT